MNRVQKPAGLAAGLLLMLTACSSADDVGGPATETVEQPAPTAASDAETSTTVEMDPTEPDPRQQLVLDALGAGPPRDDESTAEWLAEEQALIASREDFIVTCMAEQGFEYYFDPPEYQLQVYDGFVDPWGSPPWTARYGLGLSTLLFDQDDLGDSAVGYPGNAPIPPPSDEANDPSSQYLESLTEEGQLAYHRALLGSHPAFDDEFNPAAYDASCHGQANQAHPAAQQIAENEWGSDKITELRERIETSPELSTVLENGWLCVEEAGYDYGSLSQVAEAIDTMIFEIDAPPQPNFDDPEFIDALVQVQTFEVELALVVDGCGVSEWAIERVREDAGLKIAAEMGLLTP